MGRNIDTAAKAAIAGFEATQYAIRNTQYGKRDTHPVTQEATHASPHLS
jgi:hypothetical protein